MFFTTQMSAFYSHFMDLTAPRREENPIYISLHYISVMKWFHYIHLDFISREFHLLEIILDM